MTNYELDTFLTITEGVGFSDKREFYQTAYGWGFNQYFWIELEIEPVVPPVVPPTSLGGGTVTGTIPKHIEQIHVVRIYLKTPSGQIVSKRWEITKVFYNILLKFIEKKITIPTVIVKQVGMVIDYYQKIKVKLKLI